MRSDCASYVWLIRRIRRSRRYTRDSATRVRAEREARASATMRAKGIERTRAIDKTPNAARPRLIPQAYTHPLVFSLSSPTTHPLDHYPLSPPPRPPPPPPLSSSVPASLFHLPAPLTLRKSPSYPLRVPLSEHYAPFARKPTHPRSSRYTLFYLSLLLSFFLSLLCLSLYLSSTIRIFSSISWLSAFRDIVVFLSASFSIFLYRWNPITFGQSNERVCVFRIPVLVVPEGKKKKRKNQDTGGEKLGLRN